MQIKEFLKNSRLITDGAMGTYFEEKYGTENVLAEMANETDPEKIKSIHLVCAPKGLEVVTKAHPDVEIYTASIDERFNEIGYIVPGLGDAGDRLFGTK